MTASIFKQWSDEELVVRVQAGNRDAFDEIYQRYSGKIWGYFFRMLWKDKLLAQDCTQELFLKIIQSLERFDPGKTFSTWIFSIAHNMCKNEYRKHELRMAHKKTIEESPIGKPYNPDLKKFKIALQNFIDAMDEERKTLYILRFQDQITVPEISAILKIPEGTVKSRLFYLVKDLKTNLKAFENILTYP